MIDEKKLIEEMERWARANFSVLDDKYEYRLDGMIKAQDIVLAQPQANAVEIDKNFESILICAVRYAIGRQTYIPSMVIDYITPLLSHLSYNTLGLIAAEIIDHSYDGGLGDDMIDRPYWLAFKKKILAEMERRGNEANNTEKAE